MKHLHAIRSLCYAGASALLTVVAVLFQIGFNDPVQMVSAYFRSNLFLFVLFFGVGRNGTVSVAQPV